MNIKRVGGIYFLTLWRVRLSFCIAKPQKKKLALPAYL